MKNRGFILSVVFFFALVSLSSAQEKVIVEKDTLIDLLQQYRAYYAINPTASTTVSLEPKTIDKSKATRVKVRGFRVQIYSGSSRGEATDVQNSFIRQNPDVGAYLDYVEPNYRVKVGDFTSRSSASAYMRTVKSKYRNVFVFVEDVWIWR
ncbi:MAG: SPOR domain-containing protein [Sphingobacterium sp.]